jgi:hypothetical protein
MMNNLGCEAKDFWEEVRFELPAASYQPQDDASI